MVRRIHCHELLLKCWYFQNKWKNFKTVSKYVSKLQVFWPDLGLCIFYIFNASLTSTQCRSPLFFLLKTCFAGEKFFKPSNCGKFWCCLVASYLDYISISSGRISTQILQMNQILTQYFFCQHIYWSIKKYCSLTNPDMYWRHTE